MFRLIIAFVLGSLSLPAAAQRFEALVVKVRDGDSLVVRRNPVGRTSEVRMAGIDAPEYNQPYGRKAKAALEAMVLDRRVAMQVTDRDRYGRLVARVWVGDTYVNAAMAQGGHAWAFSRYLADRQILESARRAGLARRGLWALPPQKRVPPPVWRQQHPRRPAR
jgi:endonuclease YncB( thermonuclease family)